MKNKKMPNLKEYESGQVKMRQATITLLLTGNEIMLAMKKRGFGVGKWNGVGGKSDPGEEITDTAIRETREEIQVTPRNLKKAAVLNFYFPLVDPEKGWNQQVSVFTTTEWEGTPTETEEMKPQWFLQKDIPYKEMWWDDEIWLPRVLAGALVKASFMFGEDEKLLEHYIEEVENWDEGS